LRSREHFPHIGGPISSWKLVKREENTSPLLIIILVEVCVKILVIVIFFYLNWGKDRDIFPFL